MDDFTPFTILGDSDSQELLYCKSCGEICDLKDHDCLMRPDKLKLLQRARASKYVLDDKISKSGLKFKRKVNEEKEKTDAEKEIKKRKLPRKRRIKENSETEVNKHQHDIDQTPSLPRNEICNNMPQSTIESTSDENGNFYPTRHLTSGDTGSSSRSEINRSSEDDQDVSISEFTTNQEERGKKLEKSAHSVGHVMSEEMIGKSYIDDRVGRNVGVFVHQKEREIINERRKELEIPIREKNDDVHTPKTPGRAKNKKFRLSNSILCENCGFHVSETHICSGLKTVTSSASGTNTDLGENDNNLMISQAQSKKAILCKNCDYYVPENHTCVNSQKLNQSQNQNASPASSLSRTMMAEPLTFDPHHDENASAGFNDVSNADNYLEYDKLVIDVRGSEVEDYNCIQCGQTFMAKNLMINDEEELFYVNGNLYCVFRCEKCSLLLTVKERLKIGGPEFNDADFVVLKSRVRDKIGCRVCKVDITNLDETQCMIHFLQHAKETIKQCVICKKELTTADAFRKHIAKHEILISLTSFFRSVKPEQTKIEVNEGLSGNQNETTTVVRNVFKVESSPVKKRPTRRLKSAPVILKDSNMLKFVPDPPNLTKEREVRKRKRKKSPEMDQNVPLLKVKLQEKKKSYMLTADGVVEVLDSDPNSMTSGHKKVDNGEYGSSLQSENMHQRQNISNNFDDNFIFMQESSVHDPSVTTSMESHAFQQSRDNTPSVQQPNTGFIKSDLASYVDLTDQIVPRTKKQSKTLVKERMSESPSLGQNIYEDYGSNIPADVATQIVQAVPVSSSYAYYVPSSDAGNYVTTEQQSTDPALNLLPTNNLPRTYNVNNTMILVSSGNQMLSHVPSQSVVAAADTITSNTLNFSTQVGQPSVSNPLLYVSPLANTVNDSQYSLQSNVLSDRFSQNDSRPMPSLQSTDIPNCLTHTTVSGGLSTLSASEISQHLAAESQSALTNGASNLVTNQFGNSEMSLPNELTNRQPSLERQVPLNDAVQSTMITSHSTEITENRGLRNSSSMSPVDLGTERNMLPHVSPDTEKQEAPITIVIPDNLTEEEELAYLARFNTDADVPFQIGAGSSGSSDNESNDKIEENISYNRDENKQTEQPKKSKDDSQILGNFDLDIESRNCAFVEEIEVSSSNSTVNVRKKTNKKPSKGKPVVPVNSKGKPVVTVNSKGKPVVTVNSKMALTFCCDLCPASFRTKDLLQKHKNMHIQKPNTCWICKKKFTTKDAYELHMLRNH